MNSNPKFPYLEVLLRWRESGGRKTQNLKRLGLLLERLLVLGFELKVGLEVGWEVELELSVRIKLEWEFKGGESERERERQRERKRERVRERCA
jgi:hypothetical protein